MKKIIVLLGILFMYLMGNSQAITQRGTSAVTVQDARLFAQYNFRPPSFADTVSANLQIGLDSCGALIYSRDINAYYYRACSPKRWVSISSGGTTPSLNDVANVGNFYSNELADSIRLNSYDAINNIKHPILWTNDQYGGTPNNILDFSYGSGIENVAQIKFGDASNLLSSGYIKITDKESVFKNETSTRTIIQNGYNIAANTQTTYFPLMKNGTDTLATLDDIRNNTSAGTVTSISQGYGITASPTNPITTSGTIDVDTTTSGLSGKYLRLTDTSTMLSKYVPYTGATGNVNIGSNILYAESLQAKSSVYVRNETTSTNYLVMSNASNKGNVNFANQNPGQLGNVSLTVNPLSSSRNINLPDSSGTVALKDYTVNSISRTLGKDSIIFYIGSTRYAIKDSVGTNPAPVGYYGAFQDNTSQTAASINTAYAVKLNTTDLTNGVSVVNDGSSNPTRITLANTGIYNIQFSLQLEKTGGSGNMIADIWVRKNGVDIPSTTGKVVLTGSANASPVIASWNYVLNLVAGDYVQLMWATSNTNVEIIAAAATSPHPAIPSAILTVTQQSGIMAGTGITAINSLTGAAQTMVTGTDSTDFKIVSTGTTHKFNLPTASATNRGALSSADWTTFNTKLGASDTVSLSNRINLKLNIADTSTMLSKYLRKTDTASLSNRIDLRVKYTDTATMLTPYLRKIDTASLSSRINLKLNIADTSSMLSPYLRKIDTTNRFVNNISRTLGKDSIIFNIGSTRYAIKDSVGSGGGSAAGSTGNVQYNNGGAFAGSNNLFWDNSNTRLGIAQSSPTSRFHLNFDQNSVTQSDANGILLANTTAAIAGTQSISPALVWQGNGWKTTATAASQDVRFRADVLPVQGTTNPNASWRLSTSVNGGAYVDRMTLTTTGPTQNFGTLDVMSGTGNGTIKTDYIIANQSINSVSQFLGGIAVSGPVTYKTTNGGSNFIAPFSTYSDGSSGTSRYLIDNTNGFMLAVGNSASAAIVRASIQTIGTSNTAGSESGDMTFLTQTGGTAMAERMRIFGGGNVAIGTTTDAGAKLNVNGAIRWGTSNVLQSVGYSSSRGIALQIGGTSTYKLTNAGSALTPVVNIAPNGETSGAISLNYDFNNGYGLNFAAGNGTNIVARAAINIATPSNTAGSESGDLTFLTQSGGTAMSEKMRITGAGGLTINATNTASGTTGNQTINKASGTVNIAAAGTTVTVTNSLVTASSIVYAVIRTNDATATIKNVVPAAGSFVINLGAAATAETSIGFFVIN
jgi:hypothetical protein